MRSERNLARAQRKLDRLVGHEVQVTLEFRLPGAGERDEPDDLDVLEGTAEWALASERETLLVGPHRLPVGRHGCRRVTGIPGGVEWSDAVYVC